MNKMKNHTVFSFLLLAFLFAPFCGKSQSQLYPIQFVLEYDTLRINGDPVPIDTFKTGLVHILFTDGFENDSIHLFLNKEKIAAEKISTSPVIGLAYSVEFKKIKKMRLGLDVNQSTRFEWDLPRKYPRIYVEKRGKVVHVSISNKIRGFD